MSVPEQRPGQPQMRLSEEDVTEMAKPGIPVEKPQRRNVPDIPDPMPVRLPKPPEPVRTPREPVPVRR